MIEERQEIYSRGNNRSVVYTQMSGQSGWGDGGRKGDAVRHGWRRKVFAGRLLKLEPQGSRQWRISQGSNGQDKVAHTEINGLSLTDCVGVEIVVTVYKMEAIRKEVEGSGWKERWWVSDRSSQWTVQWGRRQEV
jgi:hypothetical protein